MQKRAEHARHLQDERGPEAPSHNGLLRPHVHANADAVAGVIVGTGGVLLASVFVRHVVGVYRTIITVRAVAGVVAIASGGNRIADRHGPDAIALAAVL